MYGQPRSLEELLSAPENRQRVRRGILGMEGPAAPGVALEQPDELTEVAPAPSLETPDPLAEIARRYVEAQAKGRAADRLSGLNEGFKDATETILSPRGVKMGRSAAPPSEEAKARQGYQDELGMERTRAEIARAGRVGQPKTGAMKSTDPTSPESIRAQGIIKGILGDHFTDEQIAQMTASDIDSVLKYGTPAAQREVQREGQVATDKRATADREQRAAQFAATMNFKWSDLNQDEQLAVMRIMDARDARDTAAKAKEQEKSDAISVPGYEPIPGERPTPKDAETIKGITSANGELKRSVKDLRALHAKYGTEVGGKGGIPMRQTMTAIKLAAKTIADLGALSGPDQGLMEDLAGGDPTTIEASAKAFFGVDNTLEAMTQLERWAENRIAAALEARGYRAKAAAARPTTKAVPVSPTGAGTSTAEDNKVRVMINGAPKRIPRANLEKARALAKQRGDAFEVTDG